MTFTPAQQWAPRRWHLAIPAGAVVLLAQTCQNPGPIPISVFGPQPHAVVTHHNDNARTGVNPYEQILRPTNVNFDSGQFQLLYKLPVTGQVYAQPLFASGVKFSDGTVHNLVIVATQANEVTIWDQTGAEAAAAAGVTPTPIDTFILGTTVPFNVRPWAETRLLFTCPKPPAPPAPSLSCTFSPDVSPPSTPTPANPVTGWPYSLFPLIGVTSTPVIDATTMRLYAVAMVTLPGGSLGYQLNCFDLTLPHTRCVGSPATIAGSVPGMGVSNVGGMVVFNDTMHLQRPALLLSNGRIYIGFGAHNDTAPWHGWMFAYDASTLKQTAVWCSTPNGDGGSIWQGGAGPAADENGNIYVMTSNADTTAATWTASGNFPMSFVKLDPNLVVLASFMIDLAKKYSDKQVDLGASGPVLLGSNTVVGGGKRGILYNLNRNLAEQQPPFHATPDFNGVVSFRGSGYHHLHGVPVVWRNPSGTLRVYLWGERDSLKAFAWNDNTSQFTITPSLKSDTAAPGTHNNPIPMPNMPGGGLSLSADGNTNGTAIVWASLNRDDDANPQLVAGVLRAFDAENLKNELWDSDRNRIRDGVGRFAKFTPPTVTYGRVFLATFGGAVNVYGLRQGAKFINESIDGQTMSPGPTNQLTVKSGQSLKATLFITNTGFTTWRSVDNYALGSQGPQDNTNWGTNRVLLPKDVAPYETVRIDWNGVAPSVSTLTPYQFRWRMVQDGVAWFGDYTASVAVSVTP
jgi:hypothetical protein